MATLISARCAQIMDDESRPRLSLLTYHSFSSFPEFFLHPAPLFSLALALPLKSPYPNHGTEELKP